MRLKLWVFNLAIAAAFLSPLCGEMANIFPLSIPIAHGQTPPIPPDIPLSSQLLEADQLLKTGESLYQKSQLQEALKSLQKALTLYRAKNASAGEILHRQAGEVATLHLTAVTLRNLGQYPQAMTINQQALVLHNTLMQTPAAPEKLKGLPKILQVGKENLLNSLGIIHTRQGNHTQALELYQQALELAQSNQDRSLVGALQNNIGTLRETIGDYLPAIAALNNALIIATELDDYYGIATTYNNLGSVYDNIGQYSRALELYQWAYKRYQRMGDRAAQVSNLNNQAITYSNLGNHSKAIALFQQALALDKEMGASGEGTTLLNLSSTYRRAGQLDKALAALQKSLPLLQVIGDRSAEGKNYTSQGSVYAERGEFVQAFSLYQKGLTIAREVGERPLERRILGLMGTSLEKQKKVDLAIVFYKQAINLTEELRQGLKIFVQKEQDAYTKTVEDAYRSLANLLLQQNRVLEAQQVMDLLKVQELDDYLRNVRGKDSPTSNLDILKPEQQILEKYNGLQQTAIELGKELTQLRKIPEVDRTAAQNQRITKLVQLQDDLNRQFNAFIDSPSVVALSQQLDSTTQRQNVDLADLNALRDNLRRLNAVLIYPLILDDRLELIITTPDAAPLRRTVSLKRTDLNQAIALFRSALQDPTSETQTKAIAQQLYTWLIKPLETDLKQSKAQTLIYAPDGGLRYIPLAALYDGQQWLVERYRINHITARSLSEFDKSPTAQLRVLAGAFTQGTYQVQVGNRRLDFQGLPFAGKEVKNLAAALPGTKALFDRAFSLTETTSRMNEYPIVHLATHAAFVVGEPEESFILFGNGERATLKDIQNWSLQNVDLVVLSACETGLGGQFGNGEEILGLGYQLQRAGAKAAIASLWQVDDGGTQALMSTFYEQLKKGNISKAEALRQSQIELIQGKGSISQSRGSIAIKPTEGAAKGRSPARLNHPYYWAPFILIGNGL
jgi:CHAT domain-containing protein/tetratricopeptide (TPR) repeat protein